MHSNVYMIIKFPISLFDFYDSLGQLEGVNNDNNCNEYNFKSVILELEIEI